MLNKLLLIFLLFAPFPVGAFVGESVVGFIVEAMQDPNDNDDD